MYLVTIGDDRYFLLVCKSVDNAKAIYPSISIVIYDWGFTKDQRIVLENKGCEIISWDFIEIPVPFYINNREWLLCQKPYCYRDFMRRYNTPFLFLDGDAYMVDSIPHLLECTHSIGVTVRRAMDQEWGHNRCRVINSGVLKINNEYIINKWIERMQQTKERLAEQTSLTRLLFQENGNRYSFRVFPCDIYNYYWVDTSIPDTAKIIHLKGKGVKRKRGFK